MAKSAGTAKGAAAAARSIEAEASAVSAITLSATQSPEKRDSAMP